MIETGKSFWTMYVESARNRARNMCDPNWRFLSRIVRDESQRDTSLHEDHHRRRKGYRFKRDGGINGNVQRYSISGYYRLERDTQSHTLGPLSDGIAAQLQGRQSDKYMDMPSRKWMVNLWVSRTRPPRASRGRRALPRGDVYAVA